MNMDLMNPNHEGKSVGKFDLGFAHALLQICPRFPKTLSKEKPVQ